MIIVSQEKNRIINFDNILQIYITIEEDDRGCYIQYEDCNNSYEGLGKYNTEERAKEVLQEIIGMYQASKMFMATKGVLTQEEMCKAMLEKGKLAFVYEMPEN